MAMVDVSFSAFALFSLLRVLAYIPQIVKIAHASDGARVISNTMWTLFALSHFTTALYAWFGVQDVWITVTFVFNGLGCAAIVGLTLHKRRELKLRLDGLDGLGGLAARVR